MKKINFKSGMNTSARRLADEILSVLDKKLNIQPNIKNYELSKFIKGVLMKKLRININQLRYAFTYFKSLDSPYMDLRKIITEPYRYITYDAQFISFKTCEYIDGIYDLCTDINTKMKSFICETMLKRNMFYIEKHRLEYSVLNSFYFKNNFSEMELIDTISNICKIVNFNKNYYSLPEYFDCEINNDKLLKQIYQNKETVKNNYDGLLETMKTIDSDIQFTTEQEQSIKDCFKYKFNTIVGYPGTGKTTIMNFVIKTLKKYYGKKYSICIMAPTGQAVNTLKSRSEIKPDLVGTIHKLTNVVFYNLINQDENTINNYFKMENEQNQEPDIIICDESSMINSILFNKLLHYCEIFGNKLILIGDNNQLPAIGHGDILNSIINSKLFNVNKLTIIKRQNGHIPKMIKQINQNNITVSDFDNKTLKRLAIKKFRTKSDIQWKYLQSFITKYKLNANNTQFLSPQSNRKDENKEDKIFSFINLNKHLQKVFNSNLNDINKHIPMPFMNAYYDYKFIVGDKIVRTVNNYSKDELYANGDTAVIAGIDTSKSTTQYIIKYDYYDKVELVTNTELYDYFDLNYCKTVHKAQGGEYENVVLFMWNQHSIWRQNDSKKLFYTAVSRAKNRCFIICNHRKQIEQVQIEYKKKYNTLFLKE